MNTVDEAILQLIYDRAIIVKPDQGQVIFTRRAMGKKDQTRYSEHESKAKGDRHGILRTCISLNKQVFLIELARIVWVAVNGPIPDGHYLWYADGDKTNIKIGNLILVDFPRRKGKLFSMKCECGKVRLGQINDTNEGNNFWYAYSVEDINGLMSELPVEFDLNGNLPNDIQWNEPHHMILLRNKLVCHCTFKD